MEELLGFPYEQSWRVFNGQLANNQITWDTNQAVPEYSGDNEGYDEAEEGEDDGPYTQILEGWQELAGELFFGKISFVVEGMEDLNNTAVAFKDSKFLRISVTVTWDEIRGRKRHLRFETLKF